jgi:hypothetical protein
VEAKVTITATAREFDLLRQSVTESYDSALAITALGSVADAATKSAARKQAVELSDLLAKLR